MRKACVCVFIYLFIYSALRIKRNANNISLD